MMRRLTSVFAVLVLFVHVGETSAGEVKIYYSEDGTGTIWKADPNGLNAERVITGLPRVYHLDVDIAGGKIYWAGWTGSQAIHRANLDGTNPRSIVERLDGPYGIALDRSAGRVYWTNHNGGTVQSSLLDGTDLRTDIDGLRNPHEIAVDVANGKMYWAEQGPGKISRADLDGRNIELVVETPGPHGLDLDLLNDKIYWTSHTDNTPHMIYRSDLDGQNMTPLRDAPEGSGISLDIEGIGSMGVGTMYWVESTGRIRRANLDGTMVRTIVDGLATPIGVQFVPEPSTILLVAFGALAVVRRRRW